MKVYLSVLFIFLCTTCSAQKFSSEFCNNLKILSNDAQYNYQHIAKKYKGYYQAGVYFIAEPEVGTDVYAVDTAKNSAFFYRSFANNATAQHFLNDVLEPALQKCFGDQNWEFDMSDFSRVWTLPSPRAGYHYKMTLSTKSSNQNILIACFFNFIPKK